MMKKTAVPMKTGHQLSHEPALKEPNQNVSMHASLHFAGLRASLQGAKKSPSVANRKRSLFRLPFIPS